MPNWTSRVIVASILAGSISPSRWRRPTSGSDLGNAAALAEVAALSSGTATAVTAEADKNVQQSRQSSREHYFYPWPESMPAVLTIQGACSICSENSPGEAALRRQLPLTRLTLVRGS